MTRKRGASDIITVVIFGFVLLAFVFSIVFYGNYRQIALVKGTGVSGAGCAQAELPTINDATAFATSINTYIKAKRADSPLNGLGTDFVTAGQSAGVNPALIIAFSAEESSFGTSSLALSAAKNSFGRRAGDGQPNYNGWLQFSSYADSIHNESDYVRRRYLDMGLISLSDIVNTYAPASDGNDTQAYISTLQKVMNEVVDAAGSSLNCGGGNLITIASAQIGLREVPDGSNYGDQIRKFFGSAGPEPWCADFVSWVYNQAGKPFKGDFDGWRIAGAARVREVIQRDGGTWTNNATDATPPQPGDAFLTQSDETQFHIGIVEAIQGEDVTTISGNHSNAVGRTTWHNYRTKSEVIGWGHPK